MDSVRKLDKQLGCGQYGIVYQGYDAEQGRFVAIKEIVYHDHGDSPEGSSSDSAAAASAICREIDIMRRAQHDNLVCYYGARRSRNGVQIIMEYVSGGSLEFLLQQCGTLPETVCRRYVRDILHGLNFLHQDMHVCHRDVKPGNVLLTADGRCKLSDFGIARTFGVDAHSGHEMYMTTLTGTPWYMAPEVIGHNSDSTESDGDFEEEDNANKNNNSIINHNNNDNKNDHTVDGYTSNADVWSLGVTLYEMISGTRPFGAHLRNATAIMFSILSHAPNPPPLPERCAVSPELRDFVRCCLVYDRRQRPGAAELLRHPWMIVTTTTTPKAVSTMCSPTSPHSRGERATNRGSMVASATVVCAEEEEERDEHTRPTVPLGARAPRPSSNAAPSSCSTSVHVSVSSDVSAHGQRRLSVDVLSQRDKKSGRIGECAPPSRVDSRVSFDMARMTQPLDAMDLMQMSRDGMAPAVSPAYAALAKLTRRVSEVRTPCEHNSSDTCSSISE